LLRVLRALLLAGILLLCASASARAGEVSLDGIDVTYWVTFADSAGVPDDIRIVSPAKETIVLLGPTVTAGKWCVPVPGGASCTHPTMSITGGWGRSRIALGGADDTLRVEAPQPMDVDGGEGNDRITLGPATGVKASGMNGDDTLSTAGPAVLDGGAGNDQLSATAASSLSGGTGTDRLTGSGQNDVLVDVGDPGAQDAVACNGGVDVTQVDAGDALEGCSGASLDDLSTINYYWQVRFGPRVSFPTRMLVRWPDYSGDDYKVFAYCLGAPCHGAKLGYPRGVNHLRFVSGGKRVRFEGRWWRGVSPGAIVRVGFEFTFGNVKFTKGLEFRTRARKLPVRRKRCTVTILEPQQTSGREREVPCT
jgi:hypothetical protein